MIQQYEHYSVIMGLDETILELNPYIEEYGYEFIKVDFELFEERFSDLVDYDRLNDVKTNASKGKSFVIKNISYNLLKAFQKTEYYNHNLDYYCVFLKNTSTDQKKYYIDPILTFSKKILEILRLLSKGYLFCVTTFSINNDNRIISKGSYERNNISNPNFYKTYDSKSIDIDKFKTFLKDGIPEVEVVGLAKNYYFLTFNISNKEAKYILLITALESILNQSKDQITHVFSRHLALLFSVDNLSFENKYKEFKKIYGKRSNIVHGNKEVKFEKDELENLQNIVRETILKCIELNLTKKELFERLNSSGYSN